MARPHLPRVGGGYARPYPACVYAIAARGLCPYSKRFNLLELHFSSIYRRFIALSGNLSRNLIGFVYGIHKVNGSIHWCVAKPSRYRRKSIFFCCCLNLFSQFSSNISFIFYTLVKIVSFLKILFFKELLFEMKRMHKALYSHLLKISIS
jgi:hypothetical protein